MKSISLTDVYFSYAGGDALYSGLSAVFRDNGVVAIVGDNGAGKSTLIKIITGELLPDSGRVVRDATCAVLGQMNPHGDHSGGQRQMAEIRRVFDTRADILILDEPTNNLDADARAELFAMMARYDGGIIVVSHDRELLRRVDAIWELSHGVMRLYGGDYDFYVAEHAAAQNRIATQYVQTQKRINELNRTLRVAQTTRAHHEAKQKKEIGTSRRSRMAANALRGKSQETEAKQRAVITRKIDAQLRTQQELSQMMRDDTIKIPMPSKPFYSKDLIQIHGMSFAYDGVNVFDGFDFVMHGGQRVHLVGNNGAGKSTLLKIICGALAADAGVVRTFGRIAYLNQDLSLLSPDKSVVENIMDVSGALRHDAHAIAASFGFRGAASHRRVGTLSGGELLKATLAAVLGGENQPDLLILDEPTNNLDIKSTAILEEALRQYRGAILVVSHDADFIRSIADDWIRLDIGKI